MKFFRKDAIIKSISNHDWMIKMVFDFTKETDKFIDLPNRYFYLDKEYGALVHIVSGLPGTGKTTLVKDYCLANKNSYYLSLKDATEESTAHSLSVQAGVKTESLEAVFTKLKEKAGKSSVKIVIDDSVYSPALKKKILSFGDERTRYIIVEDSFITEAWSDYNTRLIPKTPADFCKAIHGWDRSDLVRLWAITGGLPAVTKEIDISLSFEDNLKNIITPESSFVTFFPYVMRRYFRTPETYYPVLKAIALGKERISDIAKYTGYPNNKCDTYVKNLIDNNFVFAAKYGDSKYATYHITNSYFKFWILFIQPNLDIIRLYPEKITAHILKYEDSQVAIPAYRECCIKYIKNYSDYNICSLVKENYCK